MSKHSQASVVLKGLLDRGFTTIRDAAGGDWGLKQAVDEGCQYSNNEIEAAVDEATRAGTYVLAHAYSAEAITRALKAGVRTIEHANLIYKDAAELAAANEIIASATSVGAQVLRREGQLGIIAAGATADLLVADGNPLDDISLLAGHGEHYLAIMKEGRFHKNRL